MITLTINGKRVKAEENATLLSEAEKSSDSSTTACGKFWCGAAQCRWTYISHIADGIFR